MNFKRLEPFLNKRAAEDQISPEEVSAILQAKQNAKQQNKNPDDLNESQTADIAQSQEDSPEAANNTEGEMLEKAFPELEVENAIVEVKELKPFNTNSETNETIKSANYWDLLKVKYGNNCR